uniref:Uncharacterized protein n=1 Tax=Panagrolaimus sp. ES5 TaxID=591445 RepID=A0AC34G3V1_9BILA
MFSDADNADSFDILSYSLGKFTNLTNLTLPWQPNVTSLEKCAKLPNLCKMKRLTLIQIPAIIPPTDVAAFINQHFEDNGFMCLSFLIQTTESYREKIKSLINSKKFQLRIEFKPADAGFVLRP